jgi:hypothetical protein
MVALMKWLSLLSDQPMDGKVWDQVKEQPWDFVLRAVAERDPSILNAWIGALRPIVGGWWFPPEQPQTEKEILAALMRPRRPDPKDIRRENVVTRIFQLLNRRLEDAYMTRSGDVDRWERVRKNKGHRLPEPVEQGRYTWYDARLYDLRTREVVFEVPRARPLFYPQNIEEVLARFLRYAGMFAALGVATYSPDHVAPVPPLPPGRATEWTCHFCKINLLAAVVNGAPTVWCPNCFTERLDLAWVIERKEETEGVKKITGP